MVSKILNIFTPAMDSLIYDGWNDHIDKWTPYMKSIVARCYEVSKRSSCSFYSSGIYNKSSIKNLVFYKGSL